MNLLVDAAIRDIAYDLDIRTDMAERLRKLCEYEIVIVCDDSGSMKTPVDNTERTRWDELCHIVKVVIRIGVIFDSNGVDIHFLNRESYRNVTNPRTVDKAFEKPPRGFTSLVPVLNKLFESRLADRGRDKKLLVFIATDGAPTDGNGNEVIDELKHCMEKKRRADTTHVSFLLCTDEPACVKYMAEWDREMINVDVSDDFNTERNTIRKNPKNKDLPFSHGDYIVKALVGAIDRDIDRLNELF